MLFDKIEPLRRDKQLANLRAVGRVGRFGLRKIGRYTISHRRQYYKFILYNRSNFMPLTAVVYNSILYFD